MISGSFKNLKILITGHTGFKGSWLMLWLHKLGADLTGFALDPVDKLGAFNAMDISHICNDRRGDINNLNELMKVFNTTNPAVVFHLAAQSLVLQSYADPLGTFKTNILGTANVLEACRMTKSVKAVIVVTSDKCYENRRSHKPFRETDRMGGEDPYSASKAAAELIAASFRKSYFNLSDSLLLATVRAGNVIGGGDFSANRIIPDCIRAFRNDDIINLRNPEAVRPWQHVLDPLHGYLILASKLYLGHKKFAGAWNFGPQITSIYTVKDLVRGVIEEWGSGRFNICKKPERKLEATTLHLDISKSEKLLGWYPVLSFDESVALTVDWYKKQSEGGNMQKYSLEQIDYFSRRHDNR